MTKQQKENNTNIEVGTKVQCNGYTGVVTEIRNEDGDIFYKVLWEDGDCFYHWIGSLTVVNNQPTNQ